MSDALRVESVADVWVPHGCLVRSVEVRVSGPRRFAATWNIRFRKRDGTLIHAAQFDARARLVAAIVRPDALPACVRDAAQRHARQEVGQ